MTVGGGGTTSFLGIISIELVNEVFLSFFNFPTTIISSSCSSYFLINLLLSSNFVYDNSKSILEDTSDFYEALGCVILDTS